MGTNRRQNAVEPAENQGLYRLRSKNFGLGGLVQRLAPVAVENAIEPLVIEFAHPPRYDDGGEDIAEEVGDGADLRHEPLDAEQQGEAANRQNAEGRDCRGERDKAGTGDTGRRIESSAADRSSDEYRSPGR